MTDLMKATLAAVGWEVMECPFYSPEVTLPTHRLFGLMKVHLRGQKFQTDDELKCHFLNWIYMQDKIGNAAE
jgi:hypothetical protein